MIGASKILTVSYGTFSCTLEGFDDPFNTMKAIAEYFRDLAAEDRYFGAEPPTPDAAMLHKIAEREIQRRVEAKIQENGVILRAGDVVSNDATRALPREQAATPTAPIANDIDLSAPAPSLAVAAAPVAAPVEPPLTAAAEPAPQPVSESVAAKLMRIRTAVAQAQAAPAPSVSAAAMVAEAVAEYSEDEHADLAESDDVVSSLAMELAAEEAETEEAAVSLAICEIDASTADLAIEAAADMAADDLAKTNEAEFDGEGFGDDISDAEIALDSAASVAADDEGAALADETLGDFDDEFAEPAVAAEPTAAALAAEIEAALPEEDEAARPILFDKADSALPENQPAPQDDDALLASLAGLNTAAPAAEMTAPELSDDSIDDEVLEDLSALDAAPVAAQSAKEQQEDLAEHDGDDALAGILASLGDDTAKAAEPAPATEAALFDEDEDDFAELSDDADTAELDAGETLDLSVASVVVVDAEVDTDEGIDAETEAVNERAQRARARVIKIRRAGSEAFEATAEPKAATEKAAVEGAILSPEAEADLMRELAEVEKEASPRAAPPSPEVTASPSATPRPVRPVRPVRHMTPPAAEAPEQPAPTNVAAARSEPDAENDISRLIAQTNTEMQGPENRRRLSAIAHLKAAVAATVAERRSGGAAEASEAERTTPYRKDLSRMVRPTAAAGAAAQGGATAGSHNAARATPLVLVSEQRVDKRPAIQLDITPARPRRVGASANLALQADHEDDDFDEDLSGGEDQNIFSDTKGFAEFADRLGAEGLEDLLEAAAAYTACVEGRPHFSRPQLIRQISGVVDEAEFTRENGLRGFGALLRAGKIAKVKRGQYALSDDSHYLVEARKIVG